MVDLLHIDTGESKESITTEKLMPGSKVGQPTVRFLPAIPVVQRIVWSYYESA